MMVIDLITRDIIIWFVMCFISSRYQNFSILVIVNVDESNMSMRMMNQTTNV
jgi:hypothetical protein